jgi:hypothetical protein
MYVCKILINVWIPPTSKMLIKSHKDILEGGKLKIFFYPAKYIHKI